MKHILVPTDFSNNAYNALFHATQLFNDKACTFYLLNVFNEFTEFQAHETGHKTMEELLLWSQEGLQSTYHRIRLDNDNPEHCFELLSKKGDLVEIISNVVNKNDIELIVIGNTGCSEISAILFGSNALRIIDRIDQCPILTVPKEVEYHDSVDIAFVTDYRRAYDAKLLSPLVFMAKQRDAKIRIMHIDETSSLTRGQEINRGILKEYLKPYRVTEHWMPLYKSKATSIQDFIEELEIGVLVMVNYKHGFFEKLTHEPVIKRVAYDADIPFLVLPSGEG